MNWLLTVWLITADGQVHSAPVGLMADRDVCNVAGQGIEMVLLAEDPRVVVMWQCNPTGAAT